MYWMNMRGQVAKWYGNYFSLPEFSLLCKTWIREGAIPFDFNLYNSKLHVWNAWLTLENADAELAIITWIEQKGQSRNGSTNLSNTLRPIVKFSVDCSVKLHHLLTMGLMLYCHFQLLTLGFYVIKLYHLLIYIN